MTALVFVGKVNCKRFYNGKEIKKMETVRCGEGEMIGRWVD